MSTVTDHLESRGVPFESIPHPQAYTSIDEARALGIAADEVVKTVVLDTGGGHVLAVIPGSHRLNMHRVHKATGDPHAHLATEEEMRRDFPEYELGAVPPLGSLLGVHVYVDPDVMQHETVLFAAGSQTESVKVRTQDLFEGDGVTVAPLSRHPEEGEEEA